LLFLYMPRRPPPPPLFPYTTLSRSSPARPHEPVAIPGGMQLASTATPGVPAQTFEAAAASFLGASDVSIELQPSTALLDPIDRRSEEHTSELQSPCNLVFRLLLEKK